MGIKKKAETDSEEDNTQFLPINYNNKINADKLKAMENVYLLQNKSHAMIVYGEKGLGKRSCTQCFIQKKKNVIKIYSNLENRFQLESVIHALKLDTNSVSSDSDLCFEEKIKKEFFAVCKKKPMIVYVEKFQDFDSQTAAFLVEITEMLLSRFPNFQTFVIKTLFF